MNLLLKLRRLFSSKRNVIQTRDGTVQLSGKSLHPHWIVGRDLCMYRRGDFASVPRSKRRSALALRLPVWSPFERTGHHCVWSGGSAMVWLWDEDRVGADREPSGTQQSRRPSDDRHRTPRVRVLPETVFYPRRSEGLYVQPCRKGFELQSWRSGELEDAFWFPERPDAGQLRWFLDRQGARASAEPVKAPVVAGAALAPEPWPVKRSPGEWLMANERVLVTVCLLALLMIAAWQEARFWKIHHLRESVVADLARMQDELDPLLAARNELLRLRRTNQALSAILTEPSQARLMGLVDRAIPSAKAQFREWRYQQGELTVVVEDPHVDPITYVRSLEAEPLFEQVRAEPAHGENRIEIKLRVRV